MNTEKKTPWKHIVCLGLEVIIICCVVFSDWISVSCVFGSARTSLGRILKLLTRMHQYLDDAGYFYIVGDVGHRGMVFAVYVVVYGFLLAGAWFTRRTLSDAYHGRINGVLFTYAIALSITIIAAVFFMNMDISTDMRLSVGMGMDEMLRVEPAGYVTLAAGVIGTLMVRKMPDEKNENSAEETVKSEED